MTDFTRKYSRKNFCEKKNNVGFVRSKSIIRIYVKKNHRPSAPVVSLTSESCFTFSLTIIIKWKKLNKTNTKLIFHYVVLLIKLNDQKDFKTLLNFKHVKLPGENVMWK